LLRELGDGIGKSLPHGGRKVHHPQPVGFDANLVEDLSEKANAPFRAEVAFEKMATALQATRDKDAVGSALESLHDVHRVNLPRAGDADDADVGRILCAKRSCKVCGGVRTVVATKGEDLRFKLGCVVHYFAPIIAMIAAEI
jgi:hypothetical protein